MNASFRIAEISFVGMFLLSTPAYPKSKCDDASANAHALVLGEQMAERLDQLNVLQGNGSISDSEFSARYSKFYKSYAEGFRKSCKRGDSITIDIFMEAEVAELCDTAKQVVRLVSSILCAYKGR